MRDLRSFFFLFLEPGGWVLELRHRKEGGVFCLIIRAGVEFAWWGQPRAS